MSKSPPKARQNAAQKLLDILSEIHLMTPYVTLSPRAYRALQGAAAYVKACASEQLMPGVTDTDLVACIDHTGDTLKIEQQKSGPPKLAFLNWVNKVYDASITLATEIHLEISQPSTGTPEKHLPRPIEP